MLAKIRQPGESFDLVFPGPSVLSKMVYTDLLQPLNHTYVPHLEERLAGVPGPLVRPGRALHGALHDLRHGRAVPRRPGERACRRTATTCCGTRQYAGKIYLLDDLARSHRHVAAAQRHHRRHQHLNADVRPEGHRLADRADRPGERQDRRQRLLRGPRGHGHGPPGLVRRPDRRVSTTCRRARRRRSSATGVPTDPPTTRHRQRHHRDPEDRAEAGAGAHDDQRPARQRDRAAELRLERLPAAADEAVGEVPDRPGLHPREPHERRRRARSDFDQGLTFYEVSPSTEALWRTNWARFKAGA